MDFNVEKTQPEASQADAQFKVPSLGPIAVPKKIVKPNASSSEAPPADIQPSTSSASEDAEEISITVSTPSDKDESKTDAKIANSGRPGPDSSEKKNRQPGLAKRVELKLNYQEPNGAMLFDSRYNMEVLKAGSIVDQVKFPKDKSFLVVGRTPACDIVAENPTVSRMHAIFQFIGGISSQSKSEEIPDSGAAAADFECKERGLYLYDLNSTHGTFLNKNQIYPNRYYRLRVGHMVKFGNSTRQYIVDGPEDQEEESDKTVTELLKERLEKEFIRKKLIQVANIEVEEKVEDTGISWGMGDDAVEDTDYSVNPFSLDFESSDLNLENPKKTLAGWFEREGYDSLFYDVREKTSGHFICRVNLPLDGPTGAPVFAEVDVKGKKKEAVAQCALKACQILDKYGVLRQSHQEGYKKKLKDWEERDYYSSDEDTFLDRTGSIESKRKRRMKESGKDSEKAESYDSLNEKYNSLEEEIQKLEQKIQKAVIKQEEDEDEVDPLEAFMQSVKSGALDIKQMKSKVKQLKEEQSHLKKLIEIARPASLPSSLSANPNKLSIKQEEREPSKASDVVLKEGGQILKLDIVKTETPEDKPQPAEHGHDEKASDPASTEEDRNRKKVAFKFSSTSKRPVVEEEVENPGDDDEALGGTPSIPSKKKRKRNRAQHFKKDDNFQYDDDNYSEWVPPTDQAGDGKIKLNEKLGY